MARGGERIWHSDAGIHAYDGKLNLYAITNRKQLQRYCPIRLPGCVRSQPNCTYRIQRQYLLHLHYMYNGGKVKTW